MGCVCIQSHSSCKVPVGMTLGTYLLSDKAYSSPLAFKPERWLPSHTEHDHNRKYFHPFHRGHRMCVAQR
jgi:cytochrome P450